MHQKKEVIIWPAYFDAARTRTEGRRVPKGQAIASPKIAELKEAAEKLHLGHELVADVAYPKTPWAKTGSLLVKKKEPKENIIQNIAKQLVKVRSTAPATTTK